MRNYIIVGAGLFGSAMARELRHAGERVTVVDAGFAGSGSAAAGCVFKPSWLSGISKVDQGMAIEWLNDHCSLHAISLKAQAGVAVSAYRVEPSSLLVTPDIKKEVTSVKDGLVTLADGTELEGTVIVAAGIWSEKLCPEMTPQTGLYGVSQTYPGESFPQLVDSMAVYAPYRQALAVRQSDKRIWFGNGVALTEKSFNKRIVEVRANSLRQAQTYFGLTSLYGTQRWGVRPYPITKQKGIFEQLGPKLFVSSGGAKNGTILAVLQAIKMRDYL